VLRSFPLLILAVLIYNILALTHGFDGPATAALLASGSHVTLFSGEQWLFTIGDLVTLVAIGLLFVEVIKATRTSAVEVINHALSMIVFIIALVEFITLKAFATSPFFFITVMALFDIVAGFTISIVAAKRDLGVAGGLIGTN
jgi:hypothetical protein